MTINNEKPIVPPDNAQELRPDLAGYPSTEALVQGYRNSSQEAQKWRQRALELEQQRPQIPDRTPAPDPYSRLADYGVPADALREAVTQEIQSAFRPLTEGFQARSRVMGRYKDYTQYEQDVAEFVQQDPELSQTYNRMFNVDAAAAMEYAFLKFGETRRRSQPASAAAVSRQEQAEAQIPTSRASEGRGYEPDKDIRDLFEQGRKTGNMQQYIKARLKQAVPDTFFEK